MSKRARDYREAYEAKHYPERLGGYRLAKRAG